MTDGTKVFVPRGELRMARGDESLVCHGIGSGVAVCLFDSGRKVGAMAHAILPTPVGEGALVAGRYASTVVGALVAALKEAGFDHAGMAAVLVGGAQCFGDAAFDLGTPIVERVRADLMELGIPIVLEETGGSFNRTLETSVGTGKIDANSIGANGSTQCELIAA